MTKSNTIKMVKALNHIDLFLVIRKITAEDLTANSMFNFV